MCAASIGKKICHTTTYRRHRTASKVVSDRLGPFDAIYDERESQISFSFIELMRYDFCMLFH
jgi:hypothetical protein